MGNFDVQVWYYPKTGKGHSVATIYFLDKMGEALGFDRVMLRFESGRLYFEQAVEGHGLSLTASKIQAWAIADKLSKWEGQYPLRFSVEKNEYFIEFSDRAELKRDKKEGLRLGCTVQYTKHIGEISKREVEEVVEPVPEPVKEPVIVETPKCTDVTEMLLNKLIAKIDEQAYEEARAIAVTMRALIEK